MWITIFRHVVKSFGRFVSLCLTPLPTWIVMVGDIKTISVVQFEFISLRVVVGDAKLNRRCLAVGLKINHMKTKFMHFRKINRPTGWSKLYKLRVSPTRESGGKQTNPENILVSLFLYFLIEIFHGRVCVCAYV